MPEWCKIQSNSNCKVKCNYTIDDLSSHVVGQKKINEELGRHKHPQMRYIDSNKTKQR